jgi:hypothetical protein
MVNLRNRYRSVNHEAPGTTAVGSVPACVPQAPGPTRRAPRTDTAEGLCPSTGHSSDNAHRSAGKSTLGKIIAGAHAPDHGQLLLAGEPVRFHSPRDAISRGVILIAQELAIVSSLTVAENVFLGVEPRQAGFQNRSVLENVTLSSLTQLSRAGMVRPRPERRGGIIFPFLVLFIVVGGLAALVTSGNLIIAYSALGYASRVLSAQGSNGETTLMFTVLAGIVVGGTSILGGEGAVWRTIVGTLFIALIGNGFVLLGLNPLYEQITLGGILLIAVGADAWSRLRTG